jgi:thiamine-monophosphate kinase
MNTMQDILENATIDGWARHFQRSPNQINHIHQSDAELLSIPGDEQHCLATTVDTIVEEITLGLYRDPYTMGWVTVMASLSDLAAVGADPLGLLIAVSMRPGCDSDFVDRIARGMEDACRSRGVFILGGDTNEAPVTSLTSCALGMVPRQSVLSRKGCQPGDAVFMTGAAGAGNALGLVHLAGYPEASFPEGSYRPVAALKQGKMLREFASSCMDTSDGVLTTLDQLLRINAVGFEINCHWERILAPEVLDLCRVTDTPEWMMLAGPHGEFELIFTVPQDRIATMQAEFAAQRYPLIALGTVRERPELRLLLPTGRTITADMAPLRNLLGTVGGDLQKYVRAFRKVGSHWGVDTHA